MSARHPEDPRLAHLEQLRPERPSAPLRRRQVLEAAEECFRRHGFHASSMSEIAAAAGMSVGHIYRYFGGKDDIIAAIVENDVARMREEMDALEAGQEDVGLAVRAYIDRLVRRWGDRWRAALSLEVMAEAARNPKIASIVRKARRDKYDRIRAMMARGYPQHPPEEIARRVEVLSVFLDSVVFKAVITPGFDCEEAACTLTGCVAELFED